MTTEQFKDWFHNAYLKLRYRSLLRRFASKRNFGTPTFVEDFNSPSYNISDNEIYNNTMIMKKENVEIKDGKMLLKTKYENKEFSGWWGQGVKIWSIGWVDFRNKAIKRGVISVKCKLPSGGAENWPAIWCLRERHSDTSTKVKLGVGINNGRIITCTEMSTAIRINYNWYVWYDDKIVGFVKDYNIEKGTIEVDRDIPRLGSEYVYVSTDNIIPEIDIMEIMHGKIQQTIHYGYSITEYRTTEWNTKLGKPEDKEYEFSVEINDDGYKFYIDGVLTGVLTDKPSITEAKAYLILNNAKQPEIAAGPDTTFEILSVKYYEK
jgi:hypothetical protein